MQCMSSGLNSGKQLVRVGITYLKYESLKNQRTLTSFETTESIFYMLDTGAAGDYVCQYDSGPLFNKQTYLLLPDLVKTRNRETGCHINRIPLKFHRPLISADVKVRMEKKA